MAATEGLGWRAQQLGISACQLLTLFALPMVLESPRYHMARGNDAQAEARFYPLPSPIPYPKPERKPARTPSTQPQQHP